MRHEYHPQLKGQDGEKNHYDTRQPDPRGRRIGVIESPHWNKEVEGEDHNRKCDQTCYRENKDPPPAGLIEVMKENRVRLACRASKP